VNGTTIVVDTTPDFREQMLRYNVRHLDAVLFTHAHIDHIAGFDDIRQFNFLSKDHLNCYGLKETLKEIRITFRYAFNPENYQKGGGVPRVNLIPIANGQLTIGNVMVHPIEVYHGKLLVLGFRIGSIAYITDTNQISEASMEKLRGLDVLILDALRRKPHSTHYSLNEAVAVAQRIGAKQTYFTHICHDLLHDEVNAQLPANIQLGYDGLVIEV
jgi:phosphoribosyl 1,2-cyclic phosphate phosphodiesterase